MSNSSFEVLLVGDQPECLRLLRQQQFEVVGAGRLADGLAQLKTSPVGLVLMALSLPDSQGTEAFVKVHEAAPHLPIIVLATGAEAELAASLMPLGAQDYLLVPELTGPMLAKAIHNASERHRIREEHSRAGHLLGLLMDNIPDSIYFKDKASQFLMISRAQAKRFGLADPHLAAGKSDADFFTSDHAQQALADEQRVMQTGQPLVGIEEKETWPDGRVTWVSTTKMPLHDRAGRVFGTYGISRDITEHRRTEQVLAERTVELSKERLLLRTLIDNLPDAIYAKDTAGRKTMANPADLKNLRCQTEAEAIGKSDFDFFPKDIAEKFWADDQKVIAGKPVINREEYLFDEAGRKRWLLTSKLPLRDQDGKIVGLIGIGRDITKLKKAEEALARERLLLRALIDNLPDCIYAKDTAGRKTLANPADLKNLRCQTEAEAIGKSDFDLFPKDIADKFWADDLKVIAGQPVINREEYLFDEAGRKYWLLTSKLPLRDQDGKVVGLIGIGRNITLQKQAEEALRASEEKLRQSAAQLERSNRELQDFAYVASHDLQEPLRKVVVFGERLKEKNAGKFEPESLDYLDRMQKATGRMQTLINDLLGFSRVTTKAQPFTPINLAEVAAGVVEDLEGRIELVKGRVELGALPVIEAEPLQMRQLLQNLIGNALKFRRPEAPPVVKVEAQIIPDPDTPEKKLCRLTVSDNCIGFEEKYVDRIFNVFQRLHTRNEYEGTGMGLAIVKKIALYHGGDITAKSKPGEGSTFILTVPVTHPQKAPDEIKNKEDQTP
ncbi:MAG: PAS domain-containing protein [Limisphaerales bacterium]